MKVGFVGLGKLGLACAEVISTKYNVTGYDIYNKTSDKIIISDNLRGAVTGKDIVFIAVQTPHDAKYDGSKPSAHLPNKDFDYHVVKQVLTEVAAWTSPDTLVVLISTVLPGTTRRELAGLITTGRFVYNPYLIAMGSVEWDMVNPEMVIIGTEDGLLTGDAAKLIAFYESLMQNSPRYEVGTWDEAECIKVFYNTFISAKIGLVNMIQDVAIKQGNIDVDVVTNALARSSMRIMGPKYMTAGMGDAGPCVLPNFNLTVDYKTQTIESLYNDFVANPNQHRLIASANYTCSIQDQKKIDTVTESDYSGDIIRITTATNKTLEVTANHLVPVQRNGKLIVVRADEILETDRLFSMR